MFFLVRCRLVLFTRLYAFYELIVHLGIFSGCRQYIRRSKTSNHRSPEIYLMIQLTFILISFTIDFLVMLFVPQRKTSYHMFWNGRRVFKFRIMFSFIQIRSIEARRAAKNHAGNRWVLVYDISSLIGRPKRSDVVAASVRAEN